jgi:hypothetical protein
MMMTNREFVLGVLLATRGDDLERATAAFRGFSPFMMRQRHGESDKTRQEVLDEYRERRERYDAAIEWVRTLVEEDQS